ncbi:MAG: hypothetical protein ACR2LN_07380 [Candidatus Levyibacteriota bacterium]
MKKSKQIPKKSYKNALSGNRRWLLIAVAVSFIILLVYLISTTNKPSVSGQMRTYSDQGNYYSLQIPTNWISQEKIGSETTGLNTPHPQTSNIEVAQFYLDHVAVTMQVYERAQLCNNTQVTNTTFAGLPATYDVQHHLWTIPTADATYLISYAYPGIGGYRQLTHLSPTQVPQSVMDANQALVNSILATIKLTHTTVSPCTP